MEAVTRRASSVRRRFRLALPAALLVCATAALVAPPAALATFPGTNGRIYFDRTSIFGVAPDGSGLTQVTASDYNACSPRRLTQRERRRLPPLGPARLRHLDRQRRRDRCAPGLHRPSEHREQRHRPGLVAGRLEDRVRAQRRASRDERRRKRQDGAGRAGLPLPARRPRVVAERQRDRLLRQQPDLGGRRERHARAHAAEPDRSGEQERPLMVAQRRGDRLHPRSPRRERRYLDHQPRNRAERAPAPRRRRHR